MKVIIFGSVPLATWVVKRIQENNDLNLMGVVCEKVSKDAYSHHNLTEPSLYYYSVNNGIKIFNLDEIENLVDEIQDFIGISIRFHKILSKKIIRKFSQGIFNLHGGELPRFRGVDIANHVILENVDKGAGTIHYLDEGVDTGDIIERVYFDICQIDTAQSVFEKTLVALQKAFLNIIEKIASKNLPRISQEELIKKGEINKTYKKKDLNALKVIPNKSHIAEIDKIARAFCFKGHEPAYFLFEGKKLYVSPFILQK